VYGGWQGKLRLLHCHLSLPASIESIKCSRRAYAGRACGLPGEDRVKRTAMPLRRHDVVGIREVSNAAVLYHPLHGVVFRGQKNIRIDATAYPFRLAIARVW